jgi:hypothetical protein
VLTSFPLSFGAEGVDRGHTGLDRVADAVLAADLVDRRLDDGAFVAARNDHHAVDVAEDDVAGLDHHTVTELDRAAIVDHPATHALVLRVTAVGERRKAEPQDTPGVARIAVHDGARCAQLHGARRHQLAPERVARRRAGGDVDLAGLERIERLEHQPERLPRAR